ncbi:tryptophan 7-halogenase [Amycolatopsis sp. SID8362]|uniref:tryptophan 7-halogenase n=1 Tax=Amycolatopsis sp. SID8362 TaxID=2690346 RepID=UPI00136F9381|nr:tryptophan 7-halogenase [Amycolatopsis sp. SID8362]NBH07212.1 FAD-dependent oxidoreductase [Amycolatopsis sp. SID8362]NED43908.1 tryptophan 7-halogenase [Amycolatopsis sp. SID8362]
MAEFDVVVVGGGPGGSTAAGLVAADGHRVLLLEREHLPRYRIGESLLPATVHGICALLGVRDEIERAGFVRKRGGMFRWGSDPEPWTFAFAASDRMAGPTSYAYQVERTRFDTILLRNAARLGADVREGHRVLGTVSGGGRITGVRYLDEGGRERTATARFVVDASGHTSRLHHDVGGNREYSPDFRNLALFGYFLDGARLPEPDAGNILCAAFDAGWFWYIPLSAGLTSVGAVVRQECASRVQGGLEAAYRGLIADCPLIDDLLRDARRATEPPYDRLRVRKDYSYDRTRLHCPGMVLVGDAACFIDPVFSSGVHLATYSALLAARSINSTLAGLVPEDRCFAEFEDRYRREFGLFRDFLLGFYRLRADQRSYFRHAHQVTGRGGDDATAFADLVGGVASTGFDTFGDVLAEGAQLQLRGLLGEAAGDEAPLFPGGLVSTVDGRRWRVPDA